jgi:hypothetical protein
MALQGILKWPLIVAASVVLFRVIVERAGAPRAVSNLLSVAALTTVLGPLYFALQIGLARKPRPYLMLIQLVFTYAVCARAMVLPTYWAARMLHWTEPRFAGVDAANPLVGFIALPLITAAIWIVASMVTGSIIGFITLALMHSRIKTT